MNYAIFFKLTKIFVLLKIYTFALIQSAANA